ncbi:MAG TPA: aminotransferase class I/II-fold pyridoxal phosphate-dependent enzyme, partial [Acidimicrobiales bacterium]|nr:aminotransferase class I/II-fold pyridoxal phosphate-dependent enzyme [Acidimicrobiales bacterium]
TFEPTYALHTHIARITSTSVRTLGRDERFVIDPATAEAAIATGPADVVFVCSPNNPTGRAEPRETVERMARATDGLLVVDEAYGQFASWSAVEMLGSDAGRRIAVVRTFSKTWALAGLRLGYVIASPEIIDAAARVTLPYHLDAVKQVAGVVALRFHEAMSERVASVIEERGRVVDALMGMPVDVWRSDANFVLFRPRDVDGRALWEGLLSQSVLVRDISSWPGLEGCLRVTIGTREDCDRFLAALANALG